MSRQTIAEQRIAIAEDVIAQLKVGRYRAQTNIYASLEGLPDGTSFGDGKEIDAREVLKATKKCVVCQRGGIVLSAISLYDECQVQAGWERGDVEDVAEGGSDPDENAYINRWFSPTQLILMEQAFEGWTEDILEAKTLTRFPERFKAIDGRVWTRAYRNKTDRMDAIMRNVIANNGKFVADEIPKPRRVPLSEQIKRRKKARS